MKNDFTCKRNLLQAAANIVFFAAYGVTPKSVHAEDEAVNIDFESDLKETFLQPIMNITAILAGIAAVNQNWKGEFEVSDSDKKLMDDLLNDLPAEVMASMIQTATNRAERFCQFNQLAINQVYSALSENPNQTGEQLQSFLKYLNIEVPRNR